MLVHNVNVTDSRNNQADNCTYSCPRNNNIRARNAFQRHLLACYYHCMVAFYQSLLLKRARNGMEYFQQWTVNKAYNKTKH